MSDVNRPGLSGEDRLPWLEAVEDEHEEEGVGAGKLVAAVIAALVVLGLVIGGVFLMRQRNAPAGNGDLIAAPAGDYKQPANASDTGNVEGMGDAAYPASQGANVSSTIDTTRIPEAPVTGGVTASDATGSKALPPASTPAPTTPAARSDNAKGVTPTKTAEAAPAKTPPKATTVPTTTPTVPARSTLPPKEAETAATGASASKQIGAYSTQAKADSASSDLSGRFPALRGLSLSVRTGTSNGKTVYRIFMKGPEAKVAAVCKALHSAKEGCIPG